MAVTTIRASASSRMVREGIGIEDAAIRSDGWPDGGSAAAADKLNVAIVADSSHRRREIVIDMKIPLKIARNAPPAVAYRLLSKRSAIEDWRHDPNNRKSW